MNTVRAIAAAFYVAIAASCASAPPSVVTIAAPSKSRADLFGAAQRAVASLGYEVKSTNEAAGLITAFRPMTGMFAKPGYGHNITIEVDAGGVKVTAFPMQGVAGGESPEKIRKQVEDAIRKVLN
ncbi:MAG: hypothetical protein IPN47_23410 [Gemmatimonadetes bacterium]|nr:hypothetical protein [Gemmatimonadota bacterium]